MLTHLSFPQIFCIQTLAIFLLFIQSFLIPRQLNLDQLMLFLDWGIFAHNPGLGQQLAETKENLGEVNDMSYLFFQF